MARLVALLGLVVTLGLVRAGHAQPVAGETQFISVSGQVAADRKSAQAIGYSAISIAFTGESPDKLVWVGVVRAESWNDDAFAGRDMLALIAGHTPTMLASGNAATLAKLRQAAVGSRIHVEGMLEVDSRNILVGGVQVTPGK
jgi:hypothetical protein